jgi:hypothetical protein
MQIQFLEPNIRYRAQYSYSLRQPRSSKVKVSTVKGPIKLGTLLLILGTHKKSRMYRELLKVPDLVYFIRVYISFLSPILMTIHWCSCSIMDRDIIRCL